MSPALTDGQLRQLWVEGFPLFPSDVHRCNPANASPYVATLDQLEGLWAADSHRLELLARMQRIATARHGSIRVRFTLMGGSVLRPVCPSPRDLDVVFFYEADGASAPSDVERALAESVRDAKAARLDARFVPLDADPLIAVRFSMFFATLFSISRDSRAASTGCLVIPFPCASNGSLAA